MFVEVSWTLFPLVLAVQDLIYPYYKIEILVASSYVDWFNDSFIIYHVVTPSPPAVQVLLQWQCRCTSLRPLRCTSEVSWWPSTPSSSPEDSSRRASSTAPSAICSTMGGGQTHVSNLYECIQYNESSSSVLFKGCKNQISCEISSGVILESVIWVPIISNVKKKSFLLRLSFEMSTHAWVMLEPFAERSCTVH